MSFVELDHGPDGAPARFEAPSAVLRADAPDEAADVLAALEAALAAGRWVAGYASYELGYVLEPHLLPLLPPRRRTPLLELGVFDGPPVPARPAAPGGRLGLLAPDWDFAAYRAAFDRAKAWIEAGDVYQVNLTMQLRGRWSGAPEAIAAALAARQPVGHGGLVSLPGATLVCRSPELFFALDGRGGVLNRPMKGTAPRDPDPARDARLRDGLAADPKNRAENLMIVDLMRNDVARVAVAGSVEAVRLFTVESYATVHQMVSEVRGRLLPGVGPAGVLRALFPCGSITGAPKIRAMEIIRALEPAPRGAYCGAIGWAAPDGRADFSVAIRTLTLHPDGEATLGVGGGVVADSTARSEYREALWKARFAAPA
ncbi:aminodeoxychorismate synthase component I [Amaricoccus sp.]|uniref:aminodeoxychorismate synthase component I n=1 Tax=Amaricoccus sp. TaxID=1872485 RepID=UPI001B77FE54|nr:aminodeoxychorismate synthase component I [Amaricoccus sp.]MBP7000716.1 aminodeoxychorismate synthase component I [Amaricoccus sp.]